MKHVMFGEERIGRTKYGGENLEGRIWRREQERTIEKKREEKRRKGERKGEEEAEN